MEVTQQPALLWNGTAAQAWVESQALLDDMFRPFEELLVEVISPGSTRHVLDVGCGTGGTTVALARRLGAEGRCTGVDISEPMIAAARARVAGESASLSFVRADAQTHAFEPASFDAIVSRFGVMFFDDSIRAFENLHRAALKGGRLRCIVWRSMAENAFMTAAERAAAPLLPNLPPRRDNESGQFGFADRDRVRQILETGGWTGIEIRPIDVDCTMPEPELTRYAARMGPVGRVLQDADDELRARVVATVRPAFERYVHGAEVRFTSACWLVDARA